MTVSQVNFHATANISSAAAKVTQPSVNTLSAPSGITEAKRPSTAFNASRLGAFAARLKDSLEWLRNGGDFLYRNFYAESNDSSAVKINQSEGRLNAAKDYDVAVEKLAAGQTNTGSELYADDIYAGDTGRQTFNIELDGERHEFTVEIKPGETNEEVLNKIADAVSKEGIGIKASVSENKDSNRAALVFETEKTGDVTGNNFTVNDMIGGNLVASTGINNMTQKAQDAIYSVNGEVKNSHDNTVDLAAGLNVTLLRETGSSSVEVSVKHNTQPALDAVTNFIDAYNNLLNESRISGENNAWLENFLTKTTGSFASMLAKAGIFQKDDGSLYYNKNSVEKAVEDGSLEKAFMKINFDSIDSFYDRFA
jgi:flagellar hook-associated protein 2